MPGSPSASAFATATRGVRRSPLAATVRSSELRCGWIVARRPHDDPAFRTGQFALCWLVRGSGILDDGARHELTAGSVFHRWPGRVHRTAFSTGAQWWFIALPGAACQLVRHLRVGPLPSVFHVAPDPVLLRRWRAAADRLEACPQDGLLGVAAELLALVAELHRRGLSATDGWLERACQALGADARPIAAVARGLGCSASGFRARFATAVGESPRAWRQRQRLIRAEAALLRPGATVAGAAAEAGCSAGRLSRLFRVRHGVGPCAWRRRSD